MPHLHHSLSSALLGTILVTVLGLSFIVPPATALPTPQSPKAQTLYFPTTVGTTWVYEQPGIEMTQVATKVSAVEGGSLVNIEYVADKGERFPIHTILVTESGVSMT